MVPTVLDLLGIEPPATIRGVTQSPLHGVSFAHTLDDAGRAEQSATRSTSRCSATAPSTTTAGGRSARGPARRSPRRAWASASRSRLGTLSELDATGWELYHVAEDFAENHNVAAEHRDRLIAMIGTWYVEAGKYDVMPIDGSGLARMIAEKPLVATPRDRYIYRPDTQSIPFFAGPRVLNRPHSITADVEIPDGGAEGVLLCQGTAAGGYSFFVKDGKLRYVHNYVGRALYTGRIRPTRCPAGRHELRFEFEPTGEPDMAHGKGAPGQAPALRRRHPGRRRRGPDHDPVHAQPGRRSPAAPTPARRSPTTTPARSSSPAPSTPSRWTSAAS